MGLSEIVACNFRPKLPAPTILDNILYNTEYAAQLIYFTLVNEPRSWRMILAVTTAEESTVKVYKI